MVKRFFCVLLLACAIPAFAADNLLLEAEFDVEHVPVQAQAVYRLRFLHAVDVRDIQIVGPRTQLANLRMIDEGRVYEARRDGKRYRVHERRYAVFPFASGTLELSGAYVTARVPAPLHGDWQSVRLPMPTRSLRVLPAPREADGQAWLPAEALTLTEHWAAAADGAQTRTIRIEASGVEASQLPELRIMIPGMEVLPGARSLHQRFSGERAVAASEQRFVMLPSSAGEFAVPALHVRWWKADTGTAMLATLPQRTVRASPAGGQKPVIEKTASTALLASGVTRLMLIGAALCVLILFVSRHRASLLHAWHLRRACMTGDARGVRDGLLALAGRGAMNAPLSLNALAEGLHGQSARDAVQALERSLYGPAAGTWSPRALADVVAGVRRDVRLARRRRLFAGDEVKRSVGEANHVLGGGNVGRRDGLRNGGSSGKRFLG